MHAPEGHRTLIGRAVAGTRHKVSSTRRDLERRRLFARLGRVSYEQHCGSPDGDATVITQLVAELVELDESDEAEAEAVDRTAVGTSIP